MEISGDVEDQKVINFMAVKSSSRCSGRHQAINLCSLWKVAL